MTSSRKLTHQEIVSRQQEQAPQERFPIYVVLNNIRSLYNVGSIFRTSDGAAVSKLFLCGYTGYPPANKVLKTALGATESVPWQRRDSAVEVIQELKQSGAQILLLEQTTSSQSFDEVSFKFPVCLVLGNEVEGVDEQIVALSDGSVEIPMYGIKNSLNVSVAYGIAIYAITQACAKQAKVFS